MTKTEFIQQLNNYHIEDNKLSAVSFVHDTTKFSVKLSTEIVNTTWRCSNDKWFGYNIYHLLEVSSTEDQKVTFEPKLKSGCEIYHIYLDEHTAIYGLFKIKQFKR